METRSDGDPRVLFAMNIILSAVFGTGIIWGLSFIEIATFSPINVVTLTLIIAAVTYAIVM
ncbi:hypothetical protein [Haloquadratum walsbyi]|jgi:hypothetical protein|uniref:DUF8107 domain-containing protein n=1 Tax=Haloquadratum walsbyi (strain DSM 16790 / HBSQ001) TaxID=362976 RepID=Q18DK7_HALWD|nr:hypothetical protein [Haloquadratum walsbyi]CAJ51160.1 uncharacterized protein HQ_1030A [Haloquadratum walsbyi DSM 16790]